MNILNWHLDTEYDIHTGYSPDKRKLFDSIAASEENITINANANVPRVQESAEYRWLGTSTVLRFRSEYQLHLTF